jgi:hypothetical protein
MLFTIVWISGGFEQHYRVTESKTEMLVNQNVISNIESQRLLTLKGERFVNLSRFKSALESSIVISDEEKRLSVISSAFIEKGVPARLTTFVFALVIAVFSTILVKPKKIL